MDDVNEANKFVTAKTVKNILQKLYGCEKISWLKLVSILLILGLYIKEKNIYNLSDLYFGLIQPVSHLISCLAFIAYPFLLFMQY